MADQEVTRILQGISQGTVSTGTLLPVVYDELRRLAAHRLDREPAGHTLQPTALLHEAYLRLVSSDAQDWQNRAHFFGAAAEAMRRILVDYARARNRQKRGGQFGPRLSLDDHDVPDVGRSEELLALDEALTRLEQVDETKADVVKLKYFGGLTNHEVAEALRLSLRTVERNWTFARAWLYREMADS